MNDYRAKKLFGGKIITICPTKVPRLIGKQGSMIELIKNNTGCQIVVGQNGRVWLKGENESLATKAILMVEREAHTEGLTDRITKMLKKEGGKTIKEKPKEIKPEEDKIEVDEKPEATVDTSVSKGGEINE